MYNVCFIHFMHNIILLKGTMRRRKIRKSSGVGRRMNPASKRIRQVSPRSLRRIQKRFFWFSLYLWVPRAKLKRFRSKSGLNPVFFRSFSGTIPEWVRKVVWGWPLFLFGSSKIFNKKKSEGKEHFAHK